MVSENKTLSTGAPKEGFLVGFALGLVALVLSICCMSATAQLAYADTESTVGTGAYTTSENISVAAEDDSTTALATFTISATNDQKDAREILALVNQARTKAGVGALMWDYELEKAAIQRAAETLSCSAMIARMALSASRRSRVGIMPVARTSMHRAAMRMQVQRTPHGPILLVIMRT